MTDTPAPIDVHLARHIWINGVPVAVRVLVDAMRQVYGACLTCDLWRGHS